MNMLHFNIESNCSLNWWQPCSSYFYPVVIPVFPIRALGVVSLLKALQMSIRKCQESTSLSVVELCSVARMDVLTLKNCNYNTNSAVHWEIFHVFFMGGVDIFLFHFVVED